MTKPRTRTQKIHRKRRGPRRGFKSRSQRGGFFGFGESNQPVTNTYGTEPNISNPNGTEPNNGWFDKFFGNFAKPNASGQPASVTSPYSSQVQTNNDNMDANNNNKTLEYQGGRKKCKRHHKHSRKCKK